MSAVLLSDVAQLEQALGLTYSLGEEQRAVVTAPLDSALVVAGAGSGKTETLSLRVAWLVGTGQVRADEVLGLTFTRKAAGELAERVTRAVERMQAWSGGPGAPSRAPVLQERPQARTYHSFAADLVQTHAALLHLDEVRLLGEAAAHQLVDRVVRGWAHPLDLGMEPRAVAAAVLDLAGECAEHRVDPDRLADVLDAHLAVLDRHLDEGLLGTKPQREVGDSLRRRRELVPLLAAYTARKRDAGLLDHGDQVLLAAEVAAAPGVAEQLRAEHRVVFLDEYQDTSAVQTDLLAALFGRGHPVTAVGDPHQSIFGWRGASSGTLGRFLRRFTCVDGGPPAQFTLSTSWRNPRLVLDVANRVAADLRTASATTGGLEVGELHPAPTVAPGQVRAAYVETVEDEADTVARWLLERRGTLVGGTVPSQAVLCRRRSQMSRFEDALRAAGVPVVVLGLGGLLDEPEVVDLVCVLTAAADPGRGDAAVRLLTGPRWTLAPADLDALQDRARELAGDDRDASSLVDALDLLPPPGWVSPRGRRLTEGGRARCQALASVLARVRQSLHRPVVDVVLAAVAATGVDVEVLAASDDPRQARRVLDRFVAEAAGYVDVDGTSTPAGFLSWLDAAREDERGLEVVDVHPDPGTVQIITIHSAKGLEWDDVAVVDLVTGGFPVVEANGGPKSGWLSGNGVLPWPARGDTDSLPVWRLDGAVSKDDAKQRWTTFRAEAGLHAAAEERRLAYVALTRPRRSLLVTGARWGEGSRPREASVFLEEAREVGVPVLAWVEAGAPVPGEVAVNPREVPERRMPWPAPVPGAVPRVRAAAAAVRRAREELERATPAPEPSTGGWERLVDALLAERARTGEVRAPVHLSASEVVAVASDPALALADLARPVPRRPSRQARRGSRFHEWVESRSGPRHGLFEPEELLGAADDAAVDDADLRLLQGRFEASPWAEAEVVAVEVPFATPLDLPTGRLVLRGRVDAVVRSTEPGTDLDVVDWKTGRPPAGADSGARDVQLAVYRLAVARLHGLPLERVGAAFWFGSVAPAGLTRRPRSLLDEAGLIRLLGALQRG